MKRTIAIATLLFALCSASFAVIHFSLVAPQDVPEARTGVQDRPELKPLLDEFRAIIKARLSPLKLDDVAKTFGPKLATATNWWEYYGKRSGPELDQHPADLVLPIFAPQAMMVSGLHTGNPVGDKSHTDLHAAGDIGYVEFYYQLNGESVQNAAIYFRADGKFVPLKSTNDFSKRLDWDKGKLDAFKDWLDAHLVPVTDSNIPELRDLSLKMSEDQLKSHIEKHGLYAKKELQKERVSYWVLTPGGENVFVGFVAGKCMGIQRMQPIPKQLIKDQIGASEYRAWMAKRRPEPGGAGNRSQPSRSETNSTPGAAGTGR